MSTWPVGLLRAVLLRAHEQVTIISQKMSKENLHIYGMYRRKFVVCLHVSTPRQN